MDNLTPEKTKLKGVHSFVTLKKLENVEKTDKRSHNITYELSLFLTPWPFCQIMRVN